MEVYIQAASAISPQRTFGPPPLLVERVEYSGNRMTVLEPDYAALIDPRSIRRMSRIIRMGVGAASACLREAGWKRPDAIVTGTAYGCLADTGVFLSKMIEQGEELLPPTAFIQSTHNTVGGQIALMLQCHGYNNTFVHRGSSFESALLDAMLLLRENEQQNRFAHVLVGAVDEITDFSHAILSRFGLYRHTQAGEGSAFFLLTGQPTTDAYAKLEGLETFYKPGDEQEIEARIRSFLARLSIHMEDIDLVITGNNGDRCGDRIYGKLAHSLFGDKATIPYKDLCGEYPTSTSFALWLAAEILRTGGLPAAILGGVTTGDGIKKILIYNHWLGLYHSLILVAAC